MADDLDSILDAAGAPAAKAPPAAAPPPAAPAGPAPDTDDLDAALNVAQPGKAEAQQAAQPSTFDSLWSAAKGAAGGAWDATKAIGHGLKQANDAVANAIVHPVDTFNAIRSNPGAYGREAMRGVNDNIPFANTAVEKMGGPAAESPEDAAAAPGVRQVGGLAGAPVGGEMVGGLAAKGLETLAPAASSFVRSFGKAAEERQTARAAESIEEKVTKRTRGNLQTGPVEDALRENPELQKAALSGHDETLAKATGALKKDAGSRLDEIYKAAPPGAPLEAPISRMDARIAELKKGTSEDTATAKQLQTIRDEFADRLSSRGDEGLSATAAPVQELRAEQSAYQKKGYGKAMPGDEAATARIAAAREASKAVGDAVVQHVTGMDYATAKAAAAADPNSLAARLFKANDQINAANKIEAGIADRAGRVQPKHGFVAALGRMAHRVATHAVLPAIVGESHGAGAGLAALAGQEALHALPGAARAGARAADAFTARAASGAAGAIDAGTRAAFSPLQPEGALAKTIRDLMKRGIPQATAIQMARGQPVPSPAFEPSMAQNPDAQPIVL
jgi:hypothetical protein